MRTGEEIEVVQRLVEAGLNDCEISRRTGIPRTTVRMWRTGRTPRFALPGRSACSRCGHPAHDFERLHPAGYSYLLGVYLGDGYLAKHPRGVYRLRIACDTKYEGIVEEIAWTTLSFVPSRHVAVRRAPVSSWGNLCYVEAYSKVWPCLFPQHGEGPKHTRSILLEPWQQRLVDAAPGSLLRGLIHSDGTRHLNRVRHGARVYEYPRYNFTSASDDIRAIFCDACDQLGIAWRRMNARNISVARREAVARLDEFVGPKA